MELRRNGTQRSSTGPAEYFTGTVRVDPLFISTAPARTSAAVVTFEPGARSNWHTHPLGQKLVVTSGCGYVQSWGEPLRVTVLETSSFALPGRSIGMGLHRVPRCRTSRSRRS
jgi:quercetin dioxygenase-like cupin family protein